MSIWTIKGESGKALDDTTRTLEDLRLTAPTLTFESFAADTFQATTDDNGTVPIPEAGQTIEIYHNSARVFLGTVRPYPLTYRLGQSTTWEAVGPLWFMEQIQVTDNIEDDTETEEERTQIAFTTGDLKAHIATLLNRFLTVYGSPSPFAIGTLSGVFDFPQITLSNQTYLSALAELCRPFPDCFTHLDYTQTPPSLNLTRRDDASILSLAQDGSGPIINYSLTPRTELQVEEVVVNYAERDDTGLATYQSQSDGTLTNPTQRQVVTVSGPELDTFLPSDGFDSVILRSPPTLTEAYPYIDSAAGYYTATWRTNLLLGSDHSVTTGSLLNSATSSTGYAISSVTTTFHAPRLHYDGTTGSANDSDVASYTLLLFDESGSGDPPQWLIDQLGLVQGHWTGGIHHRYPFNVGFGQERIDDLFAIAGDYIRADTSGSTDYNYGGKILSGSVVYPNGEGSPPYEHREVLTAWLCPTASLPSFETASGSWTRVDSGNYDQINLASPGDTLLADPTLLVGTYLTVTGYGSYTRIYITAAEVIGTTVRVTFQQDTNQTLPDFGTRNWSAQVPQRVYRAADWGYLAPPADLAANLKAAQDWLPYDGTVTLGFVADPLPSSLLGRALNITNGPTELTNARALIQAVRLTLGSGAAELRIGAPTRNDFPTLASRLRRTPQDNIYYLNG